MKLSNLSLKKINLNDQPPLVMNIVLDGVGISPYSTETDWKGDAFKAAHTPVLDGLRQTSLYREIYAHGTYVGLPSNNEMGNSEVGHNALGSGRIFPQGAKRVNQSIASGEAIQSQVWKDLIQFSEKRSILHFIGLLSDGYVHSHIDHLKYLVEAAAKQGIQNIFLHALLDGRDVSPHSSLNYIKEILEYFKTIREEYGSICRIASVGGRMLVVMDRYEADWKMVERGWKMMVEGEAARQFDDAWVGVETLKKENDLTDQYLEPFVVVENGQPIGAIDDGEGVVFFNYRGDRAIEICRAFQEENLPHIQRNKFPRVFFVGMMEYDGDLKIPQNYLVSPSRFDRTMGDYLIQEKISLFAVSETQKYGHVTYFWNGNHSGKIDESLETYVEIKSDLVPFEERPWMKCAEITDATIELIRSKRFAYGRINYPNGDMVGHSGDFNAARLSMEATDMVLGRLLKVIEEVGGVAIILADHGNCDEMYEISKGEVVKNDGVPQVKTSHTLNPVPCYIYDTRGEIEYRWRDNDQAGLANIAATTFNLMGYEAPDDYHPSLIEWKNGKDNGDGKENSNGTKI